MEEAAEAHARAIELDPGEPRFHEYRFYALRGTENGPRKALAWAQRMVERFPDLGLAHALLAEAWMGLDRDGEAERTLARAMALDPEDPDVLMRLGILRGRAGELERAREILERGLQLDPDHPGLLYNCAFACLRLGDLEEARRLAELHRLERPGDPQGEWLLEEIRARSRRGGD